MRLIEQIGGLGLTADELRNIGYNAFSTGSARTNVVQAAPPDPLKRFENRLTAKEKADILAHEAKLKKEREKARAIEAQNYATEAWLLFRGGDASGAATASARARELGYTGKLPDLANMPGMDGDTGSGDTGSKGSALTKAGIPTWAWVVGGVAVVGVAVYFGRK